MSPRRYYASIGDTLSGFADFLEKRNVEGRARREREAERAARAAEREADRKENLRRYEAQREESRQRYMNTLAQQSLASPEAAQLAIRQGRAMGLPIPEGPEVPHYPSVTVEERPILPGGGVGELISSETTALPPQVHPWAAAAASLQERRRSERAKETARKTRGALAGILDRAGAPFAAGGLLQAGHVDEPMSPEDWSRHMEDARPEIERAEGREDRRRSLGRPRGPQWRPSFTKGKMKDELLAGNIETAIEQLPNYIKGSGNWPEARKDDWVFRQLLRLGKEAEARAGRWRADRDILAMRARLSQKASELRGTKAWRREDRKNLTNEYLDLVNNLNTLTDDAADAQMRLTGGQPVGVGGVGTPPARPKRRGKTRSVSKPAPKPAPKPRSTEELGAVVRVSVTGDNRSWLSGLKGKSPAAVRSAVRLHLKRAASFRRKEQGLSYDAPIDGLDFGKGLTTSRILDLADNPGALAEYLDMYLSP